MASFSSSITDKFFAPYMSEFIEAEIPDISTTFDQQKYWLANYVLNASLRGRYNDNACRLSFNLMRRCEQSFLEYEYARAETISFLNGSRQSLSKYSKAMYHWEMFLGQTWHCLKLLQLFLEAERVFNKGENTPIERLNILYNRLKHTESAIERGQMPRDSLTFSAWLTNDGVYCVDGGITFLECADLLCHIGKYANILQDPVSAENKLKKLKNT